MIRRRILGLEKLLLEIVLQVSSLELQEECRMKRCPAPLLFLELLYLILQTRHGLPSLLHLLLHLLHGSSRDLMPRF